MPARILCVGHAAHDLVYRVPAIPSRGIKVIATDFYECGGGMAANAAVAVARLGCRPSYWGRIADDAIGRRILAELDTEGVDVSAARLVAGARSPVTSILAADNGERLICSYSDPTLDPDATWLPLDAIATFDAVLVDSRWAAGGCAVLDAARALRRPALLDGDVAPAAALGSLAARATHALFSSAGLDVLASGADAGAALRRIRQPHHAMVGVTLGDEGLLWLDGRGEHRLPAPRVDVVDTLAAGDVWHGAFAVALAEAKPIEEAAAFANAAAAIKCRRPGGRRGAPTRPEVEALLQAVAS